MLRADEPHLVASDSLPADAELRDVVRWAVAHAELAPSEHNVQPWRFVARLQDDTASVDLMLDERRRLPVVDPEDREAVLSCGAALLNLRLALAMAGSGADVELLPEPTEPELLARVLLRGPVHILDVDKELRRAILLRGTHRGPFEQTEVPTEVVERMCAEGRMEGASVEVLDTSARTVLAELTEVSSAQLWNDGGYRRETAAWARGNSTSHRDGVPGYAFGEGALRSWLQPVLERSGRPEIAPRELAAMADEAPALVVVGSRDDNRASLLRAGAGMQRLLLRARAEGLAASYLNAPLHVEGLRVQVARAAGVPAAQVVLRIGYGGLVRSTPRRGVDEVLDMR
ncbi:MAG: nitroreductase family protein [Mycobacteriales bacterium]